MDIDKAFDSAMAGIETTKSGEAKAAPIEQIEPVDNDVTAPEEMENPTDNGEDQPTDQTREENTPWPKKAQNAVSRRDKAIGKLKAEVQMRDQRIADYEAKIAQATPKQDAVDPSAPREDQFNNYGEYLKAIAKHEARKEWDAEQGKTRESTLTQQREAHKAQREEVVAQQAQEFFKTTPDAQQLFAEYADVFDTLPPMIEALFMEADNAPLAFYNLAKEGKLEEVAAMSPARAAMAIGQAQGKATASVRQVSNAPAPIAGANGQGSRAKSLDNMSYGEMKTWLATSSN